MEPREIPAEQWVGFIADFNRDHTGETVRIEVVDEEIGRQFVADGLPLMGISFDTRGTRPSSIEIAAGDLPSGLVRHVVDLPLAISIETDLRNHDIGLKIEPAQGPVTLLLLEGAVH